MDDIVKYMPTDRAPRPDGYSGLFMKKCWHIIKHDFYKMACDFHVGRVGLQNIYGSFIALIQRKLLLKMLMIIDFPHQCLSEVSDEVSS
jgi:hypothetical protein